MGFTEKQARNYLKLVSKERVKVKIKTENKDTCKKISMRLHDTQKEHGAIGQFGTGQGFLCIVCGVIGWWGIVGLRKVE